jgi:hypothetical protein
MFTEQAWWSGVCAGAVIGFLVRAIMAARDDEKLVEIVEEMRAVLHSAERREDAP